VTDCLVIVIEPQVERIEIDAALLQQVSVDTPGLVGPPGPPGGASYEHYQAVAAPTWTVNHNLGFRPSVSVRDAGGSLLLCEIVHVSINQSILFFAAPAAGAAYCV
jgi:hypothetical protein